MLPPVKDAPSLSELGITKRENSEAKVKLGEMLGGLADPTASRAGRRQLPEGISHKESHKARTLAANPEVIEQVKAKAHNPGGT